MIIIDDSWVETYRLGVDLLGLVVVGEVDGEGVADRQLAAVNGDGAVLGVDVVGEQDADGGVLGLVGQVDAERVLVGRDGVPGDGLGLADGPDGVLGGRGDLQGGGGRGEGEDDEGRHHFDGIRLFGEGGGVVVFVCCFCCFYMGANRTSE